MALATKFLAIGLMITGFALPAGAQVPTLETIPNWEATGVTVDVFTPSGWSAADPTVVFSHGDGLSPSPYHCYREIWAEHGIRTISPYQTNGTAVAGRQARWTEISSVHAALSQLQEPRHIFFAGHSFGAYVTSLAAGADSNVVGGQAGNCVGDECPALPAQGYVILSGQPAQNAVNAQPYWFGPSAFDDLASTSVRGLRNARTPRRSMPAWRAETLRAAGTPTRSTALRPQTWGWSSTCRMDSRTSCSPAARTGGSTHSRPAAMRLSVTTSPNGSRRCRTIPLRSRRRAASRSGTTTALRSIPNAGR